MYVRCTCEIRGRVQKDGAFKCKLWGQDGLDLKYLPRVLHTCSPAIVRFGEGCGTFKRWGLAARNQAPGATAISFFIMYTVFYYIYSILSSMHACTPEEGI